MQRAGTDSSALLEQCSDELGRGSAFRTLMNRAFDEPAAAMNEIRAAKEADFAAVHALLADSALIHEDLTPASLETFVVLPAADDAFAVIAVAGVERFREGCDGLLRSVAVSAALRGRGIGAKLVTAVECTARVLGLERLWLLTTTAPDFFRRLGYTDAERGAAPEWVRRSPEFASLCPASAVCLRKLL